MNFDKAIEFASSNEIGWSRDNSPPWGIHMEDPAPWNVLLGPVKPRGGVAGVINVGGSTIASFGDIHRPDLTFSVAKTYLALLAGLAVDDGLIQSIDTKLSEHLPGIGFDSGKKSRYYLAPFASADERVGRRMCRCPRSGGSLSNPFISDRIKER